ncbi:hypothetical protein [Halobacteriovorax sp. HLS]|uniref:hypothetical protein n=1 Tax=Halobacteriovorax sp. HLS TaxID=2234000 RepID=UPI000FD81109|nr:hypothetical protein [Halobacteriovorax sp. HLS]
MIKLALLVFACISNCLASVYCEKYPYVESIQFAKVKDNISKGLKELSSRKSIAQQADKTLSSLISARSPLITKWISSRGLDPLKNETEIVTKWRIYFLENFILGKYPSQDSSINSKIEEFFEEVNSSAFDKKTIKRLVGIFSEAKSDSISYIKSLNISEKMKLVLISRVKNVELYFFNGLEGTKFEQKPLEFLKWGLAFDPSENHINVGVNVLKYSTDGELYSVFTHEIAHAFDPCRWSAFVKKKYVFTNIINCLRSSESIGAKPRDDSKLISMVKSKRLSSELYKSLKDNPTCNNSLYPQAGMQRDQISEAFADWFSAEVITTQKKNYLKGSFRSELCVKSPLQAGSSYISNENRLNGIYLSNPILLKLYKQKSPKKYCSF